MSSVELMWPSSEIRRLTARLIASQPTVPASPGAMVGRQPLLCLAACAAEAGFRARGRDEEARMLRERAAHSADKSILYDAYDRLGWPRIACEIKLTFNDAQAPSTRRQRILEALDVDRAAG